MGHLYLISALRTGKARGQWGNTITRKGRPKTFRVWMIGQYVVVALFAAGLVWAVIRVGKMLSLGS